MMDAVNILPAEGTRARSGRGYTCPKCGHVMGVRDSRQVVGPPLSVRRRRYCRCGHRLTTFEYSVADIEGMHSLRERVRRLETSLRLARDEIEAMLGRIDLLR